MDFAYVHFALSTCEKNPNGNQPSFHWIVEIRLENTMFLSRKFLLRKMETCQEIKLAKNYKLLLFN